MENKTIHKDLTNVQVKPNLNNYQEIYDSFSYKDSESEIDFFKDQRGKTLPDFTPAH